MNEIWHNQNTYIWLGVLLAVIVWLLIRRLNERPGWLKETILYLNMKPVEVSQAAISYSKFLSKWQNIKWNYAFAGKEKGQEIVLGNFSIDDRYFYYLSYKTTVKPMLITNTDDQFDDMPATDLMTADTKYHIYSKEKFLLDKITNHPDFLNNLSAIFPGRHNWLEFTDLNQVILVTDYDFSDHQTLLKLIANFIQIKEKL